MPRSSPTSTTAKSLLSNPLASTLTHFPTHLQALQPFSNCFETILFKNISDHATLLKIIQWLATALPIKSQLLPMPFWKDRDRHHLSSTSFPLIPTPQPGLAIPQCNLIPVWVPLHWVLILPRNSVFRPSHISPFCHRFDVTSSHSPDERLHTYSLKALHPDHIYCITWCYSLHGTYHYLKLSSSFILGCLFSFFLSKLGSLGIQKNSLFLVWPRTGNQNTF